MSDGTYWLVVARTPNYHLPEKTDTWLWRCHELTADVALLRFYQEMHTFTDPTVNDRLRCQLKSYMSTKDTEMLGCCLGSRCNEPLTDDQIQKFLFDYAKENQERVIELLSVFDDTVVRIDDLDVPKIMVAVAPDVEPDISTDKVMDAIHHLTQESDTVTARHIKDWLEKRT